MKRQPSKKHFAGLAIGFLGLFILAGFLSGTGGLSGFEAFLVMSALIVIAIPVLLYVAPNSAFRRNDR